MKKILALSFICVCCFFSHVVLAATINVTTTTDAAVSDDSTCTLREAIINTNNDADTYDECAADDAGTYGDDTIVLTGDATTYYLTVEGQEDESQAGDLDIKDNLTITIADTTGSNATIEAGDLYKGGAGTADRIFHILNSAVVTLEHLTLQSATVDETNADQKGGGILVEAGSSLTLDTCTIQNNKVTTTTLEPMGGGIYLGPNTTFVSTNSTIVGNTTTTTAANSYGGGIYLESGTGMITSSVIDDNDSLTYSATLMAYAGGIYVGDATLEITNAIIIDNTANGTGARGGGLYNSSLATTSLSHTTVYNNLSIGVADASYGGGVMNDAGTLKLINTVLASNDAQSPATRRGPDCYGVLTSLGYNLISDATTTDGSSTYCSGYDTSNNDTIDEDPLLETALADNGGSVQTLAISSSSSPLVDNGNCQTVADETLEEDARGYSRSDGGCDIGAYEYIAWYIDDDGDGYGDAEAEAASTTVDPGDGYVTNNGDCNDSSDIMNPGETEVCDGADNNCNGEEDEGLTAMYYEDTDGDGYGDEGRDGMETCDLSITGFANPVTNNSDCDDDNDAINPDATEICDGVDNDCDGDVDDGVCGTAGEDEQEDEEDGDEEEDDDGDADDGDLNENDGTGNSSEGSGSEGTKSDGGGCGLNPASANFINLFWFLFIFVPWASLRIKRKL